MGNRSIEDLRDCTRVIFARSIFRRIAPRLLVIVCLSILWIMELWIVGVACGVFVLRYGNDTYHARKFVKARKVQKEKQKSNALRIKLF